MKITIDPSAKEYIQKNKQNSIIIGTRRTGGWAGGIVPFVEMGTAKEEDGWSVQHIDGISVYYRPGLRTFNQEVRISLFGAWFLKTLQVSGIQV